MIRCNNLSIYNKNQLESGEILIKERIAFDKLPHQTKLEFETEILRSNFNNLYLLSSLMLLFEVFLFTIRDRLYGTETAILVFIFGSLIFVPIIAYLRKNIATIPMVYSKLVQFGYMVFALGFTVAILLITQSQIDLTYVYASAILVICFAIPIQGLHRFFLLFLVYVSLVIFLPNYQTDSNQVLVLLVNLLMINIIAWIIGYFARNSKKKSFIQQQELTQKNELLEDLIQKDSLTGLFNHKAAFTRLRQEIDYAKRLETPLSIIVLDIDNFKGVNDVYGHLAGDDVLIGVSDLILNITRKTDIVGRVGGEEFLIILPNTNQEGAVTLALKLQQTIAANTFADTIHITLSGGISEYSNESVDRFYQLTDSKLYKAKQLGKNRFISSENMVLETM